MLPPLGPELWDYRYPVCVGSYNASLEFEPLREVIFERKLEANIVGAKAIEKVFPRSVLNFSGDRNVGYRVVREIANGVMSSAKCIACLPVGIADVDHRVADRTAELIVPLVIQKC